MLSKRFSRSWTIWRKDMVSQQRRTPRPYLVATWYPQYMADRISEWSNGRPNCLSGVLIRRTSNQPNTGPWWEKKERAKRMTQQESLNSYFTGLKFHLKKLPALKVGKDEIKEFTDSKGIFVSWVQITFSDSWSLTWMNSHSARFSLPNTPNQTRLWWHK